MHIRKVRKGTTTEMPEMLKQTDTNVENNKKTDASNIHADA